MQQVAPLRFVDRIARQQARDAMVTAERSLSSLLEAEASRDDTPQNAADVAECLYLITFQLKAVADVLSDRAKAR